MAMQTEAPAPRYITRHVTYRLPLIGRMAKEVVEGEVENSYYAIAGVVALWLCLILTFGLPGLFLPALGMTFVMFVTLIRISMG